MREIPTKPLEAVIDRIDNEAEKRCPLTSQAPIVPFTVKHYQDNGRFSKDSFDLLPLLQYLMVFKKQLNPVTKAPIHVEDIGTELVPNHALIQQIDQILAEEGYTRADLLNHSGISPELYDYLLKLNLTPRQVTKDTMRTRFFKALPFFLTFAIQLSYLTKIGMQIAKHCDSTAGESMYRTVLSSFVQHKETGSSDDGYGVVVTGSEQRWPRSATTSTLCESLLHWFDFVVAVDAGLFKNNASRDYPDNPYGVCANLDVTWVRKKSDRGQFYMEIFKFDENPNHAVVGAWYALAFPALSTYAAKRIFERARDEEPLGKFEKLLLTLLGVVILLISLDALTDCFGLFSSFGKRSVMRNACARACNDGLSLVDTIAGVDHTFRLTKGFTPVPADLCRSAVSKPSISVLNALAPASTMVAARTAGILAKIWRSRTKGEKEYRALERNGFEPIGQHNDVFAKNI